MIRTFVGGIHPPQNKELTCDRAIETPPLPDKVHIPLTQHTGAPANPVVSAGDRVKTGQKIADASAFISAPVHASVSGKVISIARHPHPVTGIQNAITIEREADDWIELKAREDYERLKRDEIREIISSAGIVGMGGAAFPTAVKITPPEHAKIDSFILNGAECEPYLSSDYRLMLENPEEIITGMKILMLSLNVERGYIAIEDNKPLAIRRMRKVSSGDKRIRVKVLKTKYPQGSEKQLIKVILGREVPSGGLPFNVGVVVNNVGTALAVREAVVLGKPLVERIITVTGPNILRPSNLRTRIGTPLKHLISFCGGTYEKTEKLITGGPMMGLAQFSLEAPVIKGTSGIIVYGEDDIQTKERFECIRCGSCVDCCPVGLRPTEIAKLTENRKFDRIREIGILDCIECGSCSYICPSRVPLLELIKYGKAKLPKQ